MTSMDPQLVALLRTAVHDHLADKGVPEEERPVVDFTPDEDLLDTYLEAVFSIVKKYQLFRGSSQFGAELDLIAADFHAEADAWYSQRREALELAFNAPFIGDAHHRLRTYLLKCWTVFQSQRNTYAFPYFALVQSAGFGKSRVIKELPRLCREDTTKTMNVLYVSTRDSVKSKGYPRQTTFLNEYVFSTRTLAGGVRDLANRLVAAYRHIAHSDNWDVISTDLLNLFDSKRDDRRLVAKFQ